MTFLRFTPRLEHASNIDLPVEILRPNLTLVTRTTSKRGAEVEPGAYHIVARLPAGQEITTSVEAQGTQVHVPLEPEPEDLSPHEWQSQRHYLVEPVSGPSHPAVSSSPTSVTLRYYKGHALGGGLSQGRIEQLVIDEQRELQVAPEPGDPAPLWVQLVQPEREPRTTALPVAPNHPCTLRFVRKPEGFWWLDVHLDDDRADLLCRYRDRGWAPEAAVVAERLLQTKLDDPIAAAVGAYAILRFQDLERLHDWTENLRRVFRWLPDGAVVRGEHLARNGDHAGALEAFVELADRGLPLFSDGLGYVTTRLETYAAVEEGALDAALMARAKALLSSLLRVASTVDFNHPMLGFSGEPTQLGVRSDPPTVRRGSKGQAVTLLQQLLHDYGYNPGVIDGDFGPNTENAVKEFQIDYGLTVDGIVGPRTWAAIGS